MRSCGNSESEERVWIDTATHQQLVKVYEEIVARQPPCPHGVHVQYMEAVRLYEIGKSNPHMVNDRRIHQFDEASLIDVTSFYREVAKHPEFFDPILKQIYDGTAKILTPRKITGYSTRSRIHEK